MKPPPRFAKTLLAWFERNRRDLPWRRTRDPYAILVSEVMLQQTRVEAVIPYYLRFLARFPDVRALAAAPVDEVLACWAGLGYYRRARLLKRTAEAVVATRGGEFPREAAELEELPGIGRYTAGAVASIAFSRPAPLVDGNVARVFARLHRIEGDVRERAVANRIWALAEELVPADRPGDFNQALMELGATICTPVNPRCEECPVARGCEARRADEVDRYPSPRARREVIAVRLASVIVRDGSRVGVIRRAGGGKMEGLHDFPALEMAARDDAAPALRASLRDTFGIAISAPRRVGTARHAITHHRITIEIHVAELAGRIRVRPAPTPDAGRGIAPCADREGLRFVEERLAPEIGLSALAVKALRAARTHAARAD
jgi:A/G-specific adenine glycosylase